MAFSYACLTLQRVVIPVTLVMAALFRPVGISFVYLLMFFISPFIPIATARNFKSSVTPYLIILIALSTILLLCHIALQVTILALQPDSLFGTCAFTEQLLRHVGFIDFRNIKAVAVVEWLAPEVLIFLTSLSVYLVTKKLTTMVTPAANAVENGEGVANFDGDNAADSEAIQPRVSDAFKSRISIPDDPNFDTLIRISPLFCLATLFFAAVLRPSVPGGFYLLIFLLSGSHWATFQTLQRGFALLLRFVMVVLVVHIICIVSYQTPWMQQNVDSRTLVSRLISLEPLVTSSCANDIRIITYDTNYKLDSFLSPIVMLFSYYALALTTKNLIKPRIVTKPTTALGQQLENGNNKFQRQLSLMTQTARVGKKDSWTKTQRLNVSIRREQRANATEPTETTPLVRHSTRKPVRAGSSVDQNTTGNSNSDIPLDILRESRNSEDDAGTSIFDQISYGIVSVGGFIYQNSYIFTNILMMAWSIVYHSWLTFVLLLWANVLWMIPNQRKAMMRSSPFIVIYAELLIIAQYIYGMDLSNDELPSKVDTTGINLAQIGLERPQEDGMQPCVPLIVKTSFLLMFWVTLRQFVKEKNDNGRSGTIVDMIGPIQLTFGTNTTDFGHGDGKKTSKFLKKAGAIIKNLLVRLWIWLLVLVIFLCAITGKQMTGFRICYMALFLFFLLVFQSSSKAWLKVMYGFWLFLIFYAMSILILVYTYQFDKFDQYWSYYLNISKTLQSDIGLERFKTKDLFLHLVSPTIIVILTVIQVHYFHKRFIDSLQQPTLVAGKRKNSRQSLASLSIPGIGLDGTDFEQSIKDLIRITIKKLMLQSKRNFKNLKNIIWRLLELHVIKLVYIAAFVCSVHVVCVLHIVFVGICVLGTMSRSKIQIFLSRIISFVVTVIILAKMIYQVTYLDHTKYRIECINLNASHEYNTAVWFGLQKATDETEGLMGLLKPYIVYMVMVTLHAVVTLRQHQMRTMHGTNNDPLSKVLFPTIDRADAEKNFIGMLKYLFNYGFYKFGFEISLITLAATITYRQDIVAIFYVGWLFVLLTFDRSKSRRIWSIFQIFIAVSILFQYILFVGLPPTLCMEYPWEKLVFNESIQVWALLPGGLNINHVHKLIFDYILLMMVNRQKHVFNIEAFYEKNDNYAGGSNKSVVHDIANLGQVSFINPTRDFLSHVRDYLDVFLNGVLCGFFWITLAVVFLAGTNIADLLALGYLIGAFVFLWQGSDFYLRPIHIILKRWKWLIFYNVSNIVIKTCLQMAGCLFMQELTAHCCWLVHMLGITCASRAVVSETFEIEEEPHLTNECPETRTQVILVWDTICFAFLLFQLRIFKSHYFCHIINDTKANTILASRGADIIEDLRQKQIEHRQEHEQEVLYKIKRKMEKIRATQQKMLRPIDKPTHFDEYGYPIPGSRLQKRKEIKLHPQAVRAGDYYMFEDMDEKFELDLIEDEVDFLDDKITGTDKMTRRKTLIDVWKDIHTADYRRKLYVRQRSYASAPGSRIGIKIDEELNVEGDSAGVRTSTYSEPIDCVRRSKSEPFEPEKLKTKGASTSKQAAKTAKKEAEAAVATGRPAGIIGEKDLVKVAIITQPEIIKEPKAPIITSSEVTAQKHHADSTDAADFPEDDIKFAGETQPDEIRYASVIEAEEVEPDAEQKQKVPEQTVKKKTKPETAAADATDKSKEDGSDSDEDMNANPIVRLLEAFLVSLTIRLNRFSRHYRYVNKILTEEKKTLKQSRGFLRLKRTGTAAVFALMKNKLRIESENEDASSLSSSSSTSSSNNALNSVNQTATNIKKHKTNNNNASTTTTTNSTTNVPPPSQIQSQSQSQPPVPPHDPLDPQHVVDIIETPLDTVDAKITRDNDSQASLKKSRKSEVVPEIRVMAPSLDPSLGGSGSLSKQWSHEKVDSNNDFNFEDDFTARDHHIIIELLISTWYAILSNTDLICYIVVFVNQVVNASIISLPLPLMVFLWGTLSLPRPTKTFWVTLIAYTQANVLIKCIFQFKLIWANYINLPNQPLSPAKIFGVELNPHYAKYDLILLLVLFLHRFILKTQGLWKSEYKDEIVHEVLILKYENRDSTNDEEDKEIITTIAECPKTPEMEDCTSLRQSPDSMETHEYLRGMSHLKRTKYLSSLRKFFFKMLNKTRLPSDVYALMFLCDFVNFFVLLFGFTAFGTQQSEGDGGVQTYLAENKVPIPFLIMLLVQFILIVIDRALYLRKALINKIIFHFFSVIGIHIWMFFVVPLVTERSFNSLSPPIIFYIIKCFYMLLSSYQIKCGYPKRILGNFLTKGFSLANMISFKVYMQIPFLYELRTILDWVCTDTTMTLFDWLKMEDIFSDIYFIKCSRQMETDFPAIRAQKKALYTKLMMGGTIILLIVISIWGPLCLFALGNAVGQSNVPYEISTTIRIGPYDPIYDTNNRESIYTFKDSMYQSMKNTYLKDKSAMTFLSGYDASDIAAIGLAGNSPSLWSISPPDKQRLLTDFKNNVPLIARFSYSLTRIPPAKGLIGTVRSEVTFKLNETFPGREEMVRMLDGSATSATVMLPALLPKFIKVLNSGDMTIVHALMPKNEVYRPLLIRMQTSPDSEDVWWEIREYCDDYFHTNTLSKLPLSKCDSGIVMYTFNDKKFPSTFSFLTAGGIIGLYTTFVLLASRFLKSFIAGQNRKIMFEDLPYVDRVLQLCLDIYLVREALEFALEEDLFAKLIFLYRSPETMIKWTRPKEEANDDETDTDSVPSRNSGRRQEQQ